VAKRTAAVYPEWLKGRVTQAAAAWVLATVFVRYCEDNGLIEWPFLAGPGDRLEDAEDRRYAFFTEHPHENDTAWLLTAFDHLAQSPPTVAARSAQAPDPDREDGQGRHRLTTPGPSSVVSTAASVHHLWTFGHRLRCSVLPFETRATMCR
jgi:hypothetical protein